MKVTIKIFSIIQVILGTIFMAGLLSQLTMRDFDLTDGIFFIISIIIIISGFISVKFVNKFNYKGILFIINSLVCILGMLFFYLSLGKFGYYFAILFTLSILLIISSMGNMLFAILLLNGQRKTTIS